MQRTVLSVAVSTCLLSFSAVALPPPPPPRPGAGPGARAESALADPFAGASFTGEMGEKGKAATEKDTLTFKDGRFHSLGCDPWGFGDAAYKVLKSPDGVTFNAETVSAKEGRMAWHGVLKGSQLEGTALWTKPGQAPAEYWFKATRQ